MGYFYPKISIDSTAKQLSFQEHKNNNWKHSHSQTFPILLL
ncbi:hypothetical protein T4B_3303 [Trichinella pseudospiralis]|uniref:Uncharacterized protein n=1 Tax=Trichinella pseudospiralis TaxID=6337 RepID=A0A0V1GB87_TRIPS|nr:hypothetical protein T4B_3303 [Trichinella pseudospiralis]